MAYLRWCSLGDRPVPVNVTRAGRRWNRNPAEWLDHSADLERRDVQQGDISLVLSGGVALGAYQGGAYAGLHEAHGRDLRWLAGSSIGAVNAAIIAGSEPDRRVAQLEAFWQAAALPLPDTGALLQQSAARQLNNWLMAMHTRAVGRAGIFTPRPPTELLLGGMLSLYDLEPLGSKLEQFINFRRLNEGM